LKEIHIGNPVCYQMHKILSIRYDNVITDHECVNITPKCVRLDRSLNVV